MTSNCGVKKAVGSPALGFGSDSDKNKYAQMKKDMLCELKRFLSPEFLSRVDETIIFNRLGSDNLEMIANSELSDLQNRMSKIGYELTYENNICADIAKKCCNSNSGAREIRRMVEQDIQNVISDKILTGAKKGSGMILDIDDSGFFIKEPITN